MLLTVVTLISIGTGEICDFMSKMNIVVRATDLSVVILLSDGKRFVLQKKGTDQPTRRIPLKSVMMRCAGL